MSLAIHEGITKITSRTDRAEQLGHRTRMKKAWRKSGILRLEMSPQSFTDRRQYECGAVAYPDARLYAAGPAAQGRPVEGLRVSQGPVAVEFNGDVLLLGPGVTATAAWMSLNHRLAAWGERELRSIFGGDAQSPLAALAQALCRQTIDGMNFGLVVAQLPQLTTCISPDNGASFAMEIAVEPLVLVQSES